MSYCLNESSTHIFQLKRFLSYQSSSYRGYTVFSFLFVCFVALRPKSTAMVIAGRSVHLTTLFPGQA